MKEKIISMLENDYASKLQAKERESFFALQNLAAQHPEFARLEEACRKAEIAVAKGGDGKMLKKAQSARDSWLAKNKIDLSVSYDCDICRDSGVAEGKRCICFLNRLNDLLIQNGTPARNTFADCDFDKIKDSAQKSRLQKVYAAAQDFCQRFPALQKKNMALIGKTGTGKTFLLSAMVSELEEKGFHVFYLSAFALNNLFLKHHTTFDNDKQVYLDSILDCDILAIDDLGTEPIYKNVTKEYLYSVINDRNSKGKCTLFSTNLFPRDIQSRYEDRIASRLLDKNKTNVIEFAGDDLRFIPHQ